MVSKPDWASESEYFIKNNESWASSQENLTGHEHQQF